MIWRWAISVFLLAHFGVISLTYSTNWRRSAAQDQILGYLQPYLIGCNWYQEMLPVEWTSGQSSSNATRVSVSASSVDDDWKPVISNRSYGLGALTFHQNKVERWIRLAQELAASDDQEGLLRLMRSLVLHLDHSEEFQEHRVVRIRLEQTVKKDSSDSADSNEPSEITLIEAQVARLEDGSIGLIPKIEEHREVRIRGANP